MRSLRSHRVRASLLRAARDTMPLLQGLMADRAWEPLAADGSALDRWPNIAAAVTPQLPHPRYGRRVPP
ncbi:hypothetical protein [Streptomyces sp. NRRL B-1347]|uniref:hypothetical protein n=1 Tax=Streptomyces sp. NRRL B-1347 TaxID=1476877 RepID=UPI001F3DB11D|nr:hypothetical protein [Streptomyces sp. NRRL B-1347]